MKRGGLFLIILSCFLAVTTGFSGTTGKIAGKVVDAETGEALPGVNMIIRGTTLGAASNLNGEYTILNIPPGVYVLCASMMGYSSQCMENLRVRVDMTSDVDFKLTPTVLETDETVTVIAERPLVQMDMTSSLSSVGSEDIEAMPVQEVNDVLELQAGLVKDASGEIHIRGGRAGEIAYWINGVASTDLYSGDMGIEVENEAVQELQVVSGTFNAEYGQAMSGVVNIITKEGGQEYHGQVKAFIGDYISSGDEFSVLNRVDTVTDPSGVIRTIDITENPLKKLNPVYNLQASLNGPIPLYKEKLRFFTTARYFSNEGWLYGREWFLPQGLPGDSTLVSMNPFWKLTSQGKITYKLNSNIKLDYDIFWNTKRWDKSQTDNEAYNHDYRYTPGAVPRAMEDGYTHILSLNHVISPKTFYELKLNRFYTEKKRYLYKNPNQTPHWLFTVPEIPDWMTEDAEFIRLFGDGGTFDLDSENGRNLRDYLKQNGVRVDYFVDPQNPEGYVHPDSSRKPAAYGFNRAGTYRDHTYRSSAYWVGKLDLTSQITAKHQIKSGLEVRFHELTLNDFTLQRRLIQGEEVVPFEPIVNPDTMIYHDRYNRKPREFSAYVQDKMEYNDLILNLGVRFDYFDANSVIPADPSDPNIYDPFKVEHKYKNPDAPESERTEYTANERREFMHKTVEPKTQWSPRLGIAYPITDKGVIHFSYGHFFQVPNFRFLYESPDFKFSRGGSREIVGNADLKPQSTVMYEIGLQQQLTHNIGLDVTMFYRDVRNWLGTSPLIQTTIPSVAYVKYVNKDYSNVRGITVQFEKRHTDYFSVNLDYSFLIAEGTYSNPRDAFNDLQANREPRLALVPLDWDRHHTVNVHFSVGTSDWRLSLIGRYWSGLPYTPTYARGEEIGGSNYSGLRENSARRPDVFDTDMRLYKQIELAGLQYTLFLNVYNLFDTRGQINVYSDTGTTEYTTNIPSNPSYDPERVGTAAHYMNRPNFYTEPRQIQVGLSIGF